MIYALDTNVISFLLRAKQNPEVAKRFEVEIEQGNDYVIPPLSYYEITWYLIRKKPQPNYVFLVTSVKALWSEVV